MKMAIYLKTYQMKRKYYQLFCLKYVICLKQAFPLSKMKYILIT